MNGNLDDLLKSLGPENPEWLQMSQKLWTQLDDMAQNDPKAYKEYIEKARKDAQNSRLVKPGWGIKVLV
jgi:predicted outer membrane protein